LKKKYNLHLIDIFYDLENCGNGIIRELWAEIMEVSNSCDKKYYQKILRDWGAIFLFILYKDTAFRDQVWYVLDKFANKVVNDEKLNSELKKLVKQPRQWYCNVHEIARSHQVDDKMTFDELQFIPKHQRQKLDEYAKQVGREVEKIKIFRG